MFSRHNFILIFIIPFCGFVVDFLTKQIVLSSVCQTQISFQVLPFLNISCVLNTGVSFGMFAGVPRGTPILLIITFLVLCFVCYLLIKEKRILLKYCYSLIIAGAWGNIIDRLIHGGVIDFIDFYIKNWHYPAFNVADSLIFCGVAGMIIMEFMNRKKSSNTGK